MASSTKPKVVVVTGASSGLGLATTLLLAGIGHGKTYKVYPSVRNISTATALINGAKEKGVTIHPIEMDVSKSDQVTSVLAGIIKEEGAIDVLINNAGFTFAKPMEETTMEEFHTLFDTCLFGVVAACKAVIPAMREQKSGHIINISSIGGLMGQPFNDAYCSAKFALSGLSESMYGTLVPLGIKVTLVCPGAITTPFLAKATATTTTDPNSPYVGLQQAYIGEIMKIFQSNAAAGIKSSQTPEEIAELLLQIIDADKPHFQYLTSDYVDNLASIKFKDNTGDVGLQTTMQRSYGGKY